MLFKNRINKNHTQQTKRFRSICGLCAASHLEELFVFFVLVLTSLRVTLSVSVVHLLHAAHEHGIAHKHETAGEIDTVLTRVRAPTRTYGVLDFRLLLARKFLRTAKSKQASQRDTRGAEV